MNNDLAGIKGMTEKQLNKRFPVGPKKDKIAIIRRSEISDYLDDSMYRQFNIWKRYHKGMGLPMSKSWAEHPSYLINIIDILENEFNKEK